MKRDDLQGLNIKNPLHLLAVGFGSGLARKAPGTWGTLAAVPFYYFLSFLSIKTYIIFLIVSSIFGIWICHITQKKMVGDDPSAIVWDEFVGYWITMLAAPLSVQWMIVGFILFRFFDILKPYPICWLDKNVRGGFGIMIDDIVAGIFALIVLQFLIHRYG